MATTIPASHVRYCGPGGKLKFYSFDFHLYKFIINISVLINVFDIEIYELRYMSRLSI